MNQKNANKFFSKILMYITITVVIIILVADILLYYALRNNELSNIYDNSKNNLSQVSYSADFMTDSARSLLVQMYLDNNISQLRYNNYNDPGKVNVPINCLIGYSQSMPFVSSIYIYNGREDTFYTTLINRAQVEKSAFFDKEIIKIMKHPSISAISKPIARRVAVYQCGYPYKKYENVYTYIFYDRNFSKKSGKVDNAIILNVSELWVRKVINSLNSNNSGDVFILDDKGRLISEAMQKGVHRGSKIDLENKLNKTSGYFNMIYNGKKSLVTYVTTKDLKWKFICVVPYTKINQMLSHVANTTFTLCLFILTLGLIISFIVSRKVSKPIDAVIRDLKHLAETRNRPLKFTKEDFFKKLMANEISFDKEKFTKTYIDNHIRVSIEENISMVILKIDHMAQFVSEYSYEDRNILKYGIMNIANEVFSQIYRCECVDMASDNIVLIFNTQEDVNDDEIKMVHEFLEKIQTNVYELLQVQLSCVIGPGGYIMAELSDLYDESIKISNYRMFYGFQSIICYNDIENVKDYVYPVDKEKVLIESMLLGKVDEVKNTYKHIINKDFIQCEYSQFETALLRLALSVSSAVETIEKTQNLKINYSFSKFVSKFDYLETLDEIEKHFFDMFDEINSKLNEKKSLKHDKLIKNIINMINQQYEDPNLCLDTLASSVNMSSVYLGRLFKKMASKSVSDYINEVRMEHARGYLLSTDMCINKIVDKVGFTNRSYFYTIFKKEYGTTPSEYRKNTQNK
ncbi:AraC family transcriptional regulator [Clostridium oryzae]|uniref:HTH-type transcriptional regulator YesS n=1 Tax=Clostridium oryzae TaxID=1450648 RepID=A0A1V4IDP4_9CLOT|nr:AraC family transcriptional regulator [Clostridium oryzae]OPJ58128.1 HTH-type transcriptional regulator YesS [Clostridium oryzae]